MIQNSSKNKSVKKFVKKTEPKGNLCFHLITLFPDTFSSYLNESILARAQVNKIIKFKFYNPRDFVKPTASQKGKDKPYLRVDDKPYGGGPGMVIQALPIIKAVDNSIRNAKKSKGFKKILILNTSPSGEQFDNAFASKTVKDISDIVIICGRYEGIDARVKKVFKNIKDISIGPFVLTGGELPAMVMIDGISRHVQGVLGNIASLEESRPSSSDVYTRPAVFSYKDKDYSVPEILTSGHHDKIDKFRIQKPGGAVLGTSPIDSKASKK